MGKNKFLFNGIAPGQTETESNLAYMENDPQGWAQVVKKYL